MKPFQDVAHIAQMKIVKQRSNKKSENAAKHEEIEGKEMDEGWKGRCQADGFDGGTASLEEKPCTAWLKFGADFPGFK